MSRRGDAVEETADKHSPRERSNSNSSSAAGSDNALSAVPQFLPLHSRVGKRYQAVIPDLLASSANADDRLGKKQPLQLPKPRFCRDKALALGPELDKYLKMARSLRDGATFDTQEQVTTLALQHLHRYDYNTTDAACALYARHSIELPTSTVLINEVATKMTGVEEAKKWIGAFYRCMRYTKIDENVFNQMCDLYKKAQTSADVASMTEATVLSRLVSRIKSWREQCKIISSEKVDCAQLLQLLQEAENMQIVLTEKQTLVVRLHSFNAARTKLKEALEYSSKRHQNKKVELNELDTLFEAVVAPKINFPEESSFQETLDEAKELKSTIDQMLSEDKVSLSLIRDVLAKIELVPVNFEQEVAQFQNKMQIAQTWLAKARRCIPNRRPTRRGGSADAKKMDLEAIRALVVDAPYENSAEIFEMQDLLECADAWAVKVKKAIGGGADVTLTQLKELLEEAKGIPVILDEQRYLEAEIAAREWSTVAASKLASRASIEEIEDLLAQAKEIREQIHPKRQSRWKPQVERDINAAMDQSRKWMSELRDNLGFVAYDKLFSSLSSYFSSTHTSKSSSSATSADKTKKKSMDAISKLIEKSQALAIDVSSYTTPLNDLLLKGVEAQAEASAILMSIGCLSGTITADGDDSSHMDVDSMPNELGDLAQASALLEKIDLFPFTFEEGFNLARIVEKEKDWAARVRDCIPPRQSRKKRLANESFTMEQLHELINESKRLRFLFRDELRILSKELRDLVSWRAKAHDVINGEVSMSMSKVIDRLQTFDLMIYGKLQMAKKKLRIGIVIDAVAEKENERKDDVDMSSVPSGVDSSVPNQEEVEKKILVKSDSKTSCESLARAEVGEPIHGKQKVVTLKNEGELAENGVEVKTAAQGTDAINLNGSTTMNMQALEMHTEMIMTHIRIESGCMQKSTAKKEEKNGDDANNIWKAKHGESLLKPVLEMAEESFDLVDSLELKEAETRQTIEDLVLSGEKGENTENITHECVRALEGWKHQLLQLQTESEVLSVEAPEQKATSLILSLLEWLQGSRSFFYDEILPLQDLVVKGDTISESLREIKELNAIQPDTLAILERMLWPLPYLKAHEKVVREWTERVHKCVADKHAHVSELQTLLDSGSGLLLEQGAFKVVIDEAKKARGWLSKLRKRLRSLLTKGIGRMSISAARSLVEEGEDIAIDIPVFDLLKEHLEIASDWENRVLASGIESGQARVASLLALLNEYDCARLVIDLDMHRDVLKSATERYCICRQPFDGLMIGCDHCDDWYHDSCIGMSKERAEKVEHYTCPSCTILQELTALLQQAKLAGQQNNIWDMQEYAKAFDKHQASVLRKIKREEKTIECTEMQLYSCTNQMNQLRARIDDIERAKACLSITSATENGANGQQQHLNEALKSNLGIPSPKTSKTPSLMVATSVAGPTATVGTNALLLAAAAAAAASTTSTVATSSITIAASTAALTSTSALSHQQYSSILIPPISSVNGLLKSTPTMEPVTKSLPTNIEGSALIANDDKSSDLSLTTATSKDSSSVTDLTSCNSNQSQTATAAPITSTTSNNRTTAPTTITEAHRIPSPAIYNPMTATLMESTERLAAIVVAGGVEQQLAKMKSEYVEVSRQVLELQTLLRINRERLVNAQQALRDLSEVFHARHRLLPFAQTWVRQVVTLLNETTILSRNNIDESTFLPKEYTTALHAMAHPPSSSPATPETMGIDKLFPGVDLFARLLRAVSWSQVMVSVLQERPSRRILNDAITYALEYGLWEDKTTITPLRSLIGRMDAWVSRAHKCITRSAAKTQQLSRLKVLMNEYSKLPLTYVQIADPLTVYFKLLLSGGVKKSKSIGDDEVLTLGAAEATAAKALDEAMIGLVPSGASSSGTKILKKQAPRKRKTYSRKDKVSVRSSKKVRKSQSAPGDANSHLLTSSAASTGMTKATPSTRT